MTASSVERLQSVPLFAELSRDELQSVAAVAEESSVPDGTTLVSQATPGREVIVLLDGGATVERDGTALGSIGPGDVVGEIGVVTRMSRTATVTTTMPSRLLVIGADAFRSLMESIPALSKEVWRETASRLEP